jgi:hypothetical protein
MGIGVWESALCVLVFGVGDTVRQICVFTRGTGCFVASLLSMTGASLLARLRGAFLPFGCREYRAVPTCSCRGPGILRTLFSRQ